MPKQQIVGSGTREDAYRYEFGPTKHPPRECDDPQHDPVHGLWFIPQWPKVHRCQWCSSSRPSPITLKLNQRAKDIKAGKVTAATAKLRMVQVNKDEWAAFKYFQDWLDKCRAEAARLSSERVTHDFGIYGKIKATEQERRLSELEVATLKPRSTKPSFPTVELAICYLEKHGGHQPVVDKARNEIDAYAASVEDTGILPVSYLSLATRLSVTEIEALRSGSGANPDYLQIQAAAQIKETRSELLNVIKGWQKVLADPDMPLADKSKAYKEIVIKHSQMLDLLPKPKKKEQLDLGQRDQTPAEESAMRAVAEFALTEPPALDGGRMGGPGPLR